MNQWSDSVIPYFYELTTSFNFHMLEKKMTGQQMCKLIIVYSSEIH